MQPEEVPYVQGSIAKLDIIDRYARRADVLTM